MALGEYRADSSDLDVYAVTEAALGDGTTRELAGRCSHARLRCPARKLELVVLSAAAARRPGRQPRWELNLNTGPGTADHVGLDPELEPGHWFVIDLALARQRAVALAGPPADEVIGAPERDDVAQAQRQAVAWYAQHDTPVATLAVACRAWHWFETDRFAGKREALRWAGLRMSEIARHS